MFLKVCLKAGEFTPPCRLSTVQTGAAPTARDRHKLETLFPPQEPWERLRDPVCSNHRNYYYRVILTSSTVNSSCPRTLLALRETKGSQGRGLQWCLHSSFQTFPIKIKNFRQRRKHKKTATAGTSLVVVEKHKVLKVRVNILNCKGKTRAELLKEGYSFI